MILNFDTLFKRGYIGRPALHISTAWPDLLRIEFFDATTVSSLRSVHVYDNSRLFTSISGGRSPRFPQQVNNTSRALFNFLIVNAGYPNNGIHIVLLQQD